MAVVKKFSSTSTQLCGKCGGDGIVWEYGDRTHGSDSSRWEKCPLCQGYGMVSVKKDTTVTITPHFPKELPTELPND